MNTEQQARRYRRYRNIMATPCSAENDDELDALNDEIGKYPVHETTIHATGSDIERIWIEENVDSDSGEPWIEIENAMAQEWGMHSATVHMSDVDFVIGVLQQWRDRHRGAQ